VLSSDANARGDGAKTENEKRRIHAKLRKQTLRARGWIEGRNLTIEYRYAEGYYERLPVLALELVNLHVHVIVTEGTPPTRAATKATRTVPIIMASTADPVGSGLVRSLARPDTSGAARTG
jgi:putative ABC transport system substrate-binding protein